MMSNPCLIRVISYQSVDDEEGIKILFDSLNMDGKRVSVIDYPLR